MAKIIKPATSGPGGKSYSSKINLRASTDVIIGAGSTYSVIIEVSAFKSGLPLDGQEVVLKERTAVKGKENFDVNGEALFTIGGSLAAFEQVKTFRLVLTGLGEERSVVVTIPAIPVVPARPKTISVVPGVMSVDLSTNTYSACFQVKVLESGSPWLGDVVLKEGVSLLSQLATDMSGQATFTVTGILSKSEKTVNYRFSLLGSTETLEQNINVPAAQPAKPVDNDPEIMVLRRYHNGRGKFRVLVRVLKAKGYGVSTPVKIWYKGVSHIITTGSDGEAIFDVPGVVSPGTEEKLTATVSGIEDESSVDIKRRKVLVRTPAFTKGWWFKTNNGRAVMLMTACLLAWIISFIALTGSDPIINSSLFNESGKGLTRAEQFYNESASIVSKDLVIPKDEAGSTNGILAVWGWLLIISATVLIYSVLSLREEIAAGFEEGVERLFDKSYAKSGDPWFEKIAKMAGSYSISRKAAEATVTNPATTASSVAAPTSTKNPSLSTLFKLDLIGGVIGAVIPAVMKKIF